MKRDIFAIILEEELGTSVVQELRFAPPRKWRFDFAIPEHKIAIEVEGGIWTKGRHITPKGFLGDMEKYNTATKLGWRVFRIATWQKDEFDTIKMIREAINAR